MNFIKRILNTKKVKEVREKISQLNDKFEISEKFEDAKEVVSDMTEKAGDKIEAVLNDQISFKTFSKVEMKVGEILEVGDVEGSEKLLKLKVSFGAGDERQIVAGIKRSYSTDYLNGKKAIFVTNMESRTIMGLESNGMILGISQGDTFSILIPENQDIVAGSKAS